MAPPSDSDNSCFLFAALQSKVCHTVRCSQLSKVKHVIDTGATSEVSASDLDNLINGKTRQVFCLSLKKRSQPLFAMVIGRCLDEEQALFFKKSFKNLHKLSGVDIAKAINAAFVNHLPETKTKIMKYNLVNFLASFESFQTATRQAHLILDKINSKDSPHQPLFPAPRPECLTQKAAGNADDAGDSDNAEADDHTTVSNDGSKVDDQQYSGSHKTTTENPLLTSGPSVSVAVDNNDDQGNPSSQADISTEKSQATQKNKRPCEIATTGVYENSLSVLTDSGIVSPTSPQFLLSPANFDMHQQNLHAVLNKTLVEQINSESVFQYGSNGMIVSGSSAIHGADDETSLKTSTGSAGVDVRKEKNAEKLQAPVNIDAVIEENDEGDRFKQSSAGAGDAENSGDKADALADNVQANSSGVILRGDGSEQNDENLSVDLRNKSSAEAAVSDANVVLSAKGSKTSVDAIEQNDELGIDIHTNRADLSPKSAVHEENEAGTKTNTVSGNNTVFAKLSALELKEAETRLSSEFLAQGFVNGSVSPADFFVEDSDEPAQIVVDEDIDGETQNHCFVVFLWFNPVSKSAAVELCQLSDKCSRNGKILMINDVQELSHNEVPTFHLVYNDRVRLALLLNYAFSEVEAAVICSELDVTFEQLQLENPTQTQSWFWSEMVKRSREAAASASYPERASIEPKSSGRLAKQRSLAAKAVDKVSRRGANDDDDNDFLATKREKKNPKRVIDLDDEEDDAKYGQIRAPMYYRKTNIHEEFGPNAQIHFGDAHTEVSQLLWVGDQAVTESQVRKESKVIGARVAYQIRYNDKEDNAQECYCMLVEKCAAADRATLKVRLDQIFKQINGELETAGDPCVRVHSVRATLFRQYAVDDPDDPFLSRDNEKKKIKLSKRCQAPRRGKRTYQPKAIIYADSNVEELHGLGLAYKSASVGRVEIAGKTSVYVNALKVLLSVQTYRRTLTNKSLDGPKKVQAMQKTANKLLYDATRWVVPTALQVYMTILREKDEPEYGLSVIDPAYLSAIATICSAVKRKLNDYLDQRNVRLAVEDKFPRFELPDNSKTLMSRHFIDLRSKLKLLRNPLFDYTVRTNEVAEARAIISDCSKLDLEVCASQPFTLAQLCLIADHKDSSLEGLNLIANDERNRASGRIQLSRRVSAGGISNDGFGSGTSRSATQNLYDGASIENSDDESRHGGAASSGQW